MAALNHAVATLRIVGENLDPDEVTTMLGHPPTKAHRKEEVAAAQKAGATLASRYSSWRLEATATEPEDLAAQVEEIMEKLTEDMSIWHDLSTRYKVDLFCGWFMNQTNEGVDLPSKTLAALASRGIALAIDIYAPEGDA
jgi:Domain of unknown function (DUF4279)